MEAGVTVPLHRLVWLEVSGFRSFGSAAVRIEMDAPLVVVHAGNSQGKTSLAEALEFLISGHSSRRELFGGAKAEYNDSLRNAHLPGDHPVYVEAEVRAPDGTRHHIRRDLICDFARGVECESRVLVDQQEAESMSAVGFPSADPPVRAPVLLQHLLRHALSTEPKQRVAYFKALLSLSDLSHPAVTESATCASRSNRKRSARGRLGPRPRAENTAPGSESACRSYSIAAGLTRRT